MPLLEAVKNIACIMCSEAPLYIYQIMGLAALNTAKEHVSRDTQRSAAESADLLNLHLLWTRITAETGQVGILYGC